MAAFLPSTPAVPPEDAARHVVHQLFLPLIAYTPDAVVILNATGQMILVNAQTEHWFGYTAQELYGQPLDLLVSSGLPLPSPQRSPLVTELSVVGRRKHGEEFAVDLSLSPVWIEDALFVMSLLRDTTARA